MASIKVFSQFEGADQSDYKKGHEDLQPHRHLKWMQPLRSPLPLLQTLNCCTVFFIYRLNNPVSVTRGQRLNRVTSLIYRSQPIWTCWDNSRFYELFCNHSTKTTFFQTYFLTLSEINYKNYHFHTFSALKSTKWNPNESYAISLSEEKTMKIINFVLDVTWTK